ncbi:MAG: protein kinase [bacterium]
MQSTGQESRLKDLLYHLGKSYLDRQQYDKAYEKLCQLFELEPNNSEVSLHASFAAIGLEDVSETALGLYEKAVSLNPRSEELIWAVASLFARQQVIAPFAIAIAQKALELSVQADDRIRNELMRYHRTIGRTDNGYQPTRKALPVPLSGEPVAGRIEKLCWDGRFSEARELLQRTRFQAQDQEACRLALASTHAYEAIANGKIAEDMSVIQTICAAMAGLHLASSMTDLRNYLTLRLALPDILIDQEPQVEYDEYEFILGLIPIVDFFSRLKSGSEPEVLRIDRFDLVRDILEPLASVSEAPAPKVELDSEWQGVLFTQLRSREGVKLPEKTLQLVSSYLCKIPDSVLRISGTGFISLARDPFVQVKQVVNLLQILEDYNRAAARPSQICLSCGLVIASGKSSQANPFTLRTLVKAAHLLYVAQQYFEDRRSAGKFLLLASPKTLATLEANGTSLLRVQEAEILPGEQVECAEIIWNDPLAKISRAQTYILGDYEVKESLLEHASYATYLAIDRRLSRRVVLKVIPPRHSARYLQSENDLDLLYDSIRAIGRISHPSIATIFEMGEQDYMIYLAREYIEGATLTSVDCSSESWEYELSLTLLKIVRALMVVHAQGAAHLNLKPANIWLTEAQGIKITDFQCVGFQKEVVPSNIILYPAHWRYLAPETLASGEGDIRSDIYSLGTIAYEILADHHPYDSAGKIETPQDVFKIDIPPLENPARPHHKKWRDVIMKAVTAEPDKRFQSLQELEAQLREIQTELVPPNTP